MARYGVVWFGWLCCRRPSPRPLPPVPLWGPSWEGPLFRAGRRTSKWMSKSSGGPLQWRLFVYTIQSRHTSLAAQPTDNFWCPNRRWVCVAAQQPWASAVQDKGVSRIPDTHIPTISACLPAFSVTGGTHTYTYMRAHTASMVRVDGRTGSFIMGQEALGGELTSVKQQQSQRTSFASQRCERSAAQKETKARQSDHSGLPSSDHNHRLRNVI